MCPADIIIGVACTIPLANQKQLMITIQGIYLLTTIVIILPGMLYCTLGHGKLRANNNNYYTDAFIAFDHAQTC